MVATIGKCDKKINVVMQFGTLGRVVSKRERDYCCMPGWEWNRGPWERRAMRNGGDQEQQHQSKHHEPADDAAKKEG